MRCLSSSVVGTAIKPSEVRGLATLPEALDLPTETDYVITFTDKGAEKVKEFLASQGADIAHLRPARGRARRRLLRLPVRARVRHRSATATRSSRTTACACSSTARACPTSSGAVVDYVESLQGAGFKVDNPNVIAACGCGSSFRVADEEEVSAV